MSRGIGGGVEAPEVAAAAEGGRQRVIGMVLITAAMACFILSDAAAKRLTAEHQVAQIIWVRYLFHLLAMVVVLAPFGRLSVRTARLPLQIGRSLFLLLATYCFITGLSFLPMAEATTLSPLLIDCCVCDAAACWSRMACAWASAFAAFSAILRCRRFDSP